MTMKGCLHVEIEEITYLKGISESIDLFCNHGNHKIVLFLFLESRVQPFRVNIFNQGIKYFALSKSSPLSSMEAGILPIKFRSVLYPLTTTIVTRCFRKLATVRSRELFRKPAFLCTEWN